MRGCVYSANIGSGKIAQYDWTEPHNQPEEGVIFQHIRGIAGSRREARYLSRVIKIAESPKCLTNGWYAWLDSSMKLSKPIGAAIDRWFSEEENSQLIVVKHPWRDCAYDEIDECLRLKKISEEEAQAARAELTRREHPKHYGLWSLGFVAFKHMMFDLRMKWWELFQIAPRDQFWLPTLVREREIKIKVLDMNIYDNKYWKYKSHGT